MPRSKSTAKPADGAGVAVAVEVTPRGRKLIAEQLAEQPAPAPARRAYRLVDLPIALIAVGSNVRSELGDLTELADSIRERGVLQPVLVRTRTSGSIPDASLEYTLEVGHRRLAAAVLAGLESIPALVVAGEVDEATRTIDQLVENVQRVDLDPIDQARGYRAVIDAGMVQGDLARMLGIHPSTLSNQLRLLELDPTVQAAVATGEISKSHAKAIVALPAKQQRTIADEIKRARDAAKPITSHDLEQQLKWREGEVQVAAAKAKRTARVIPAVLELLAGQDLPKETPLDLTGGYYDTDVDAVRKAVAKAGYNVSEWLGRYGIGRSPECSCVAFEVSIDGRKPKLEPICIVREHVWVGAEAKRAADDASDALRRARWQAVGAAVRQALVGLPAGALRALAVTNGALAHRRELLADGTSEVLASLLVDPIVVPYRAEHTDGQVLALLAELGVPDPGAAQEAASPSDSAAAPRKRSKRATTPAPAEPADSVEPEAVLA